MVKWSSGQAVKRSSGQVVKWSVVISSSLHRRASQTRSGRNIHRPVLFAEEQWRLEDEQRRRSRMRRMRREQPDGEQLLIEGGAEDLDLEEDEQEPAI